MSKPVLDASAILALLQSEPGSDVVAQHVPGAVVSAVNVSEVIAKLAEGGMPEEMIRAALAPLQFDVYSFDAELAYEAGLLRPQARTFGLSFGDRACVALARRLGVPVLTTEQSWRGLRLGVNIVVAR